MAFDGIVMAALGSELRHTLCGGAISKIAMPEKDELLITIRNNSTNYRLLISAGATLPLMYLTESNKPSPLTAPSFCMLLRKYVGNARIIDIRQDKLERIIRIEMEHIDDLGDLSRKFLIVELMGKYSNIIFTKSDDTIIDSIKRVPSSISSLREVLPGRKYSFPEELMKRDILTEEISDFKNVCGSSSVSIEKTLYQNYAGISPLMARELCFRAGLDFDMLLDQLEEADIERLYREIELLKSCIANEDFYPVIISRNDEPVEFNGLHLITYEGTEYEEEHFESISCLLEYFYASKDSLTRIRQKSADLRKIVTNALERAVKKYDIQEKQLKECSEKNKYQVYGDLLNTYGYSLKGGDKSFTCENYYDNNKTITIPLDEHKTGTENAKRYFDKYSKLRRTEDALCLEIQKTKNDVEHLSSILQSLDMSASENDLGQIKEELSEYGYIKQHVKGNKKTIKADPLHFISSDGFNIYVGKNNYQNEEVSFKLGTGDDWWFHAKGVPGSHVLVKTGNIQAKDIPDRLFEEAAGLAAYYSKNNTNEKVEIDYTQRKNLKRVTGGAPGFVIYHTNYSMVAKPRKEI